MCVLNRLFLLKIKAKLHVKLIYLILLFLSKGIPLCQKNWTLIGLLHLKYCFSLIINRLCHLKFIWAFIKSRILHLLLFVFLNNIFLIILFIRETRNWIHHILPFKKLHVLSLPPLNSFTYFTCFFILCLLLQWWLY